MRTLRDKHEVREYLNTQKAIVLTRIRNEEKQNRWTTERAILALLESPSRVYRNAIPT